MCLYANKCEANVCIEQVKTKFSISAENTLSQDYSEGHWFFLGISNCWQWSVSGATRTHTNLTMPVVVLARMRKKVSNKVLSELKSFFF